MHKGRLRFSSTGPLLFQQHSPWAGGHLGQAQPRGPLSSQCPTHPGRAPARPSALLSLCPLSNGHSQGQQVHRICPGGNFTALFLLCWSFNWVKKRRMVRVKSLPERSGWSWMEVLVQKEGFGPFSPAQDHWGLVKNKPWPAAPAHSPP